MPEPQTCGPIREPCGRCGYARLRHCQSCSGCWGGHYGECAHRPVGQFFINYPSQVYVPANDKWILRCSNAKHCGNTATTIREVQGQPVRMCESCAAEYDEGGE